MILEQLRKVKLLKQFLVSLILVKMIFILLTQLEVVVVRFQNILKIFLLNQERVVRLKLILILMEDLVYSKKWLKFLQTLYLEVNFYEYKHLLNQKIINYGVTVSLSSFNSISLFILYHNSFNEKEQ